MARSATDFGEHNTQRAVEATNYGVSWMCEIAEQNLNQSKAAADTWLTVTPQGCCGIGSTSVRYS